MDYCNFKVHEWNRPFYNLNIFFSLEVSFTEMIKSWQLLPAPALSSSVTVCAWHQKPLVAVQAPRSLAAAALVLLLRGALPHAEIKAGPSGCVLVPLLSDSVAVCVVWQLFRGGSPSGQSFQRQSVVMDTVRSHRWRSPGQGSANSAALSVTGLRADVAFVVSHQEIQLTVPFCLQI